MNHHKNLDTGKSTLLTSARLRVLRARQYQIAQGGRDDA